MQAKEIIKNVDELSLHNVIKLQMLRNVSNHSLQFETNVLRFINLFNLLFTFILEHLIYGKKSTGLAQDFPVDPQPFISTKHSRCTLPQCYHCSRVSA